VQLRHAYSHAIIILWFRQTHGRHAIIILWVLHAYRHAITIRRRLTHAPLTWLARTPRQHDGCHAFLWKNSSCYHHLVISTYAWSCYHPSRDWHARPFTRLMRSQSSCYHHLVSSTDTSTCSHHAIISLWVRQTHRHCGEQKSRTFTRRRHWRARPSTDKSPFSTVGTHAR